MILNIHLLLTQKYTTVVLRTPYNSMLPTHTWRRSQAPPRPKYSFVFRVPTIQFSSADLSVSLSIPLSFRQSPETQTANFFMVQDTLSLFHVQDLVSRKLFQL
jgi:hypothetical protein